MLRSALVFAVVVAVGVETQQFVSARTTLGDAREALERARQTVAETQRIRAEQDATTRTATTRARATRRTVAAVVEARESIELAIAQAQQELSGTNALVEKAAQSLFTVAGASNDVSACLDGVTIATVAISAGDDHGALNALRSAAAACDRTLVANDANVACHRGPLDNALVLQAFFNQRSELWAGADLTGVVPLPDGRNLWLFGDTLYTPVNDDGARGEPVGFGNNSAFVQSGGCMRHVAGDASRRSWIAPSHADGSAYWPGGGVVAGDEVHLFLGRVVPEAPFGRLLDRAVATLALPDLRVVKVSPLPFGPADPGWGASVISPGDGFLYVYGADRDDCDWCFATEIYVARVPTAWVGVEDAWNYWDGGGWSDDRGAAKSVMAGGGAHVNVQPWRGGWLAISKEGDIVTPNIAGWWAPSPVGPWTPLGTLYVVPPVGSADSYSYMPNVVPRAGGNRAMVSYNVGTLSESESNRNAALYGPRFVAIDIPFVSGMS
jgi:hypothetical protein